MWVTFNENTRNGEKGSSGYCKIKRPGFPPGAVTRNVLWCQAFSFDRINRIERIDRIRNKNHFILLILLILSKKKTFPFSNPPRRDHPSAFNL